MDIDGNEIYDIRTGKTIIDIDIVEEDKIQEILEENNNEKERLTIVPRQSGTQGD